MKPMRKIYQWAWLLTILALLGGCVAIPKPKPDLTNPIRTVAIMPFGNESNSVDAPEQLRKLLAKKLQTKFYKVIDLAKIDQILEDELGITLGDQLQDVDLVELKDKIKADAYIFGKVTHYDQTTTGVLNTNRVRAELQMVKIDDDTVFWASTLGIKSESKSGGLFGSMASLASSVSDGNDEEIQWITIESKNGGDGSIFGNLVSGLVDKAVGSAMGVTLNEESVAFVNYATSSLRNGPGF